MDLCDTLGVDYVFGLPTNSRVRKHVETREADTVKHYKQHYADKETKLRRFQEFLLKCARILQSGPWGATRALS